MTFVAHCTYTILAEGGTVPFGYVLNTVCFVGVTRETQVGPEFEGLKEDVVKQVYPVFLD